MDPPAPRPTILPFDQVKRIHHALGDYYPVSKHFNVAQLFLASIAGAAINNKGRQLLASKPDWFAHSA